VQSKDSLHAVPSSVGLNYQWLRNDAIIGGARDSVYRAGSVGNYRVIITDPRFGVVCYDTSQAVKVDSVPLPYNHLVFNGTDSAFSICSQNIPLVLKGPIDPRLPLAFKYKWQDGNTSRFYTIDSIGVYWLDVYNECGSFTDTLRLNSIVPTPKFTILKSGFRDTTVCKDFPFSVSGPSGYFYRWYYQLPDGSIDSINTHPTIIFKTNEVTDPDSRFVRLTVGSPLGCSYTDTMRYTITYCDPVVWIPTAFTPQGDNKNETWAFKVYSVSGIKVTVYDRWGQMVYYAPDLETLTSKPWNGTYKGVDCIPASYKYIVEYEGLAPNQTDVLHVRKTGNVTLIR
jgi:gliding motility-associated-like protein